MNNHSMKSDIDPDNIEEAFIDTYLAFLLATASHRISSEFHEKLRELNIAVSTWRILAVLSAKQRSVNELARIVLLNQPTVSKTLIRLERDGLITRQREKDNQRSVRIGLTKKGVALVSKLIPLAKEHEADAFSTLSQSDRTKLVKILREVIKHNE